MLSISDLKICESLGMLNHSLIMMMQLLENTQMVLVADFHHSHGRIGEIWKGIGYVSGVLLELFPKENSDFFFPFLAFINIFY